MNPPYSGNLHLKILSHLINEYPEAEVVCLHPYTWLSPTNIARPMGKWRSTLNGHCKSLDIVSHDEMNSLFGTGNSIETGVISCWGENKVDLENYGLTPIQKSLYTKVSITNRDDIISLASCTISKYGAQKHFKPDLRREYDVPIYTWHGGSTLNGHCKSLDIVSLNQAKYNHLYGSVKYDGNPNFRREYDVPIYTWHGGSTLKEALLIKDDTKKVGMVLYFNSENERQNFIDSLDTKFMTWYWKTFVVEGGDNKLINYFFRMKDYTHPWTDEMLYSYFNLTEDEIKEIEKCI